MPLLEIDNLSKAFRHPDGSEQVIIDLPHFALEERAQVALRGDSGSGKTTLLHLIAGILAADSGRIVVAGRDLVGLTESQRDVWRAQSIGYVFQTFNLLPAFTCLENVLLGMAFGSKVDRPQAERLLQKVGMENHFHHRPRQLSTGQQQRVAVARAVANQPKLVLADEPTGNLDSVQARAALQLIREICADAGAALLLVSHDPAVLAQFSSVVELAQINRATARPLSPA